MDKGISGKDGKMSITQKRQKCACGGEGGRVCVTFGCWAALHPGDRIWRMARKPFPCSKYIRNRFGHRYKRGPCCTWEGGQTKSQTSDFLFAFGIGLDDRIADLPHIPFLGLSLFLSSCSDMYMCPLTAGSREHEMSWASPVTAFGHPI